MENSENNLQNENFFISGAEINDYLLETSKWGKFLAIVGYVGMGILIIIALVVMFGFSMIGKFPGTSFPMGIFGFVYIILAALYYFPVTYLYQFSEKIKQGLHSKDHSTIASGFRNLKSLYKFMGIFTIVIFSIYGLILVIAIPMALFFKN